MGTWDTDRTHKVSCYVLRTKSYSVTFHDYARRDIKFPWLLFQSRDEVSQVLKWGHISDEELEEHHTNLRRWSVGGGDLHHTTRQYQQLVARRVGWPWNGYELQKMMDAGTYPPKPLTQEQEEEFMRRRK